MNVADRVSVALRWMALSRFTAQIFMWAVTLFVIRLLDPSDYGTMGVAILVTSFAGLLNEVGFIPIIIQSKELPERLIRQVFGAVLVLNTSLAATLFLSADLFSLFFGDPELPAVVRVLAAVLILQAIADVPIALLRRDIRFGRISIIDFVSVILSNLTTLVFALLGQGVWSLVFGVLMLQFLRVVGIMSLPNMRILPLFDFRGLRPYLRLGLNMSGQRMAFFGSIEVDIFVVARVFDVASTGVFSVARHLSVLPLTKISSIINQIAFPAFSRLQQTQEKALDYFYFAARLYALVFFPMMWGLSAVSTEFVIVVLGEKWTEAGSIIAIITLVVPLRALLMLLTPMLNGLGRADIGFHNLLTLLPLCVCGVLIGAQFSLVGVAIGSAVGMALAVPINLQRSLTVLGGRPSDLYRKLAPAVLTAAIMYLAVQGVLAIAPADLSPGLRLIGAVLTGIVAYGLATLALNRAGLGELLTLARRMRTTRTA